MKFFGSKDIKTFVFDWIDSKAPELRTKKVLDFPAGNGASSERLKAKGAIVIAMDLFPSFFRVQGIECIRANLTQSIPLSEGSVDYAICQEGIEHLPDQFNVFKEFSRVLKPGGRFLVTTPNYSCLRSRISYLFCESELFGKIMAPNIVDSIWFSEGNYSDLYFGHINSVGVQKLKILGELANLKLVQVHGTRVNYTSLMLFPFLFPFVVLFSGLAYLRFKRKRSSAQVLAVKQTFDLMVNVRVLLMGHLMLEFEKDIGIAADIVSLHSGQRVGCEVVT